MTHSPSDRRAFSLQWSLCFPTAPSSPSVSPQGSPLVNMLFHLFHLVSICAAHRGLWHALQLFSLGDDRLHVVLLLVNLVHHLQVLLNDVLCGRDRTCRKIMTTWNRYSKIYGSVAESEKNKKIMSMPVKISRLAAPSCSLVNSIKGTRSSVYCATTVVKNI